MQPVVHSNYLKEYEILIYTEKMNNFHITVKPLFELIDLKAKENKNLEILRETLLSKMATIED